MDRIIPRIRFILALAGFLGAIGCGSPAVAPAPPLDTVAVAQEIASGVGSVQKTSPTGTKGPVFVFEEVHTSRVGQLQIAAMLLRLHDRHSVKNIGLEGAIWSGNPIESGWFQSTDADNGQARGEKEDLAVRMVADGEISSSELITMLFSDARVYGIEDASQYGQNLDVKGSPEIEYLLAIAQTSLSETDARQIERLLRLKKKSKALEYMLTADPWVKQQYEDLKNSGTTSSERLIERLRGVQTKAGAVGARISSQAQQDMENEIRYFETASHRSATMVDNVLQLPGAAGLPVAMIVGAAHSDKVTELLAQKGVSFALIRPVDFDPKYGSLSVAEYERKNSGKWARNSPGTLGYVLNSHHKPPPVIARATGHSYASMNLAGILIARAARSGGSFPDDVWPRVSNLPGLRIDKNSIFHDGHDVVFRAWLKQDDGSEKEVWARVGSRTANGKQPGTLEEKLIQASEQFKGAGGGGKDGKGGGRGDKNGGDEPPGKRGEPSSGVPGDIKRGKETISRIGTDTLVAFGSNREEVMRVGRISD